MKKLPTIKNKVAFYRKKRKLLQRELAERAGLSLMTIKGLERRPPLVSPSIYSLQKISTVLGVTVDKLMYL